MMTAVDVPESWFPWPAPCGDVPPKDNGCVLEPVVPDNGDLAFWCSTHAALWRPGYPPMRLA